VGYMATCRVKRRLGIRHPSMIIVKVHQILLKHFALDAIANLPAKGGAVHVKQLQGCAEHGANVGR